MATGCLILLFFLSTPSSRLTVSKDALVVLDSSGMLFFPVKTFFRFFLTSLLKTTWKKKMKTPCDGNNEWDSRYFYLVNQSNRLVMNHRSWLFMVYLPADNWRRRKGSGKSSHRCWRPWGPATRWRWWAAKGKRPFEEQGCWEKHTKMTYIYIYKSYITIYIILIHKVKEGHRVDFFFYFYCKGQKFDRNSSKYIL